MGSRRSSRKNTNTGRWSGWLKRDTRKRSSRRWVTISFAAIGMEQKMRKPEEYQFIDYSQGDFIAWNREREKHLQTIDHLKSHIAELTAERQRHIKDIAILKQAFAEATCRDVIDIPEGWA